MSDTQNQVIEEEEIEVPITKKDPRKVEQGKRLAAISREAKEKKMRKKIMEEMESQKTKIDYKWWLIGGASFVTILYFYFRSGKKEKVIYPVTKVRSPKKPESNPKNFEEFD